MKKAPPSSLRCPVCNYYNFQGKTHPRCRQKTSLDGLVSLWKYDSTIKLALHLYKYKYVEGVLHDMLCEMSSSLEEYKNMWNTPVFVPIPTHVQRERERGFDHTKKIAIELITIFHGSTLECLLKQTEYRAPQVGKTRQKRMQEIRGKYAVKDGIVLNPSSVYVIVDDVWTTGSTIKEACKVMKQAGAKTVWGVVIARG